MGYPCSTSPLNELLDNLNKIGEQERAHYRVIFSEKANDDEILTARELLEALAEQKKVIKSECNLLPRNFDVYHGILETAIMTFENDNPQPERPSPCEHKSSEKRIRKLKNNVIQVVEQCLDCGSPIADFKKINTPNWENLPNFDANIIRPEVLRYRQWHEKRGEVIQSVIGDDRRKIDFDDEVFYRKYSENFPEPFTFHECDHEKTILTLRIYSPTSSAVVKQCVSCGHHIKSVGKKSISEWRSLPLFDEELKEQLFAVRQTWLAERTKARQSAYQKHREYITKAVESGELTIEDKSTFGTYYDSPEWQRTRIRILHRDEHECQACNKPAQCVHHILYDRLGCENDLDLISLCHDCHSEVHERQNLMGMSYRLTPKEIMTLHEWKLVEQLE